MNWHFKIRLCCLTNYTNDLTTSQGIGPAAEINQQPDLYNQCLRELQVAQSAFVLSLSRQAQEGSGQDVVLPSFIINQHVFKLCAGGVEDTSHGKLFSS